MTYERRDLERERERKIKYYACEKQSIFQQKKICLFTI